MEKKVIASYAHCFLCGDTIQSLHVHDFVTCSCNAIHLDGGLEYTKYSYTNKNEFMLLSIYSNDPWIEVRKHAYRLGRGKDGKQSLRKVVLADMSDAYLQATINYVEQSNRFTDARNLHYRLLLMEKLYRAEQEIYITE